MSFPTLLQLISITLPYFGYAIFLLLWWPHRGDNRLSCLPWILASMALGSILSFTLHKIAAFFPEATKMPSENMVGILFWVPIVGLFLYGLKAFIVSWMLTANLSYLLRGNTTNTITQFFINQHSHQRIYGITILLLVVLSPAILLAQCFTGYPPHFK